MFFNMSHSVQITDTSGNFIPSPLVVEINIVKSSKNLSDTASLNCVIFNFNRHIIIKDSFDDGGNSENKLFKLYRRGQKIEIFLGYNDKLKLEFSGYIKEVKTDNEGMSIECEDGLFLFRKPVPNKVFKNTSIVEIANYLIKNIDPSFKLVCDYNIGYEKFTIHKADAIDVLQKIQEETSADVFFDTGKKELHIHGAYMYKTGEAFYSLQKNIETSSLEYKTAEDRKIEMTVESVGTDGKTINYTTGTTGGERIIKKVGRMSKSAIKVIADVEYKNRMSSSYVGSFDTWLIPYVEPGYTIGIDDEDFPEKDDLFYCESVTTNFSENGGKRTVTPSIKLSGN